MLASAVARVQSFLAGSVQEKEEEVENKEEEEGLGSHLVVLHTSQPAQCLFSSVWPGCSVFSTWDLVT